MRPHERSYATYAVVRCSDFMCPNDDIPKETPSTQTERTFKRGDGPSRRRVGPESETRGGPEAVDEPLEGESEDSPHR